MDREAWCAAIHGVAKSWTQLSDWTELNWTEEHVNPLLKTLKWPTISLRDKCFWHSLQNCQWPIELLGLLLMSSSPPVPCYSIGHIGLISLLCKHQVKPPTLGILCLMFFVWNVIFSPISTYEHNHCSLLVIYCASSPFTSTSTCFWRCAPGKILFPLCFHSAFQIQCL